MRRIRTAVVATALGLFTLAGPGTASASTCAEDLQEVCAVAATVICKVVAKGQPCLM